MPIATMGAPRGCASRIDACVACSAAAAVAPSNTDREFYGRETLDRIAASITLAERLLRRAGHLESSLESRREAVDRVNKELADERGKLVFEKRALKVRPNVLEGNSMSLLPSKTDAGWL